MNKIETKILNCSAVREAEKNMVFAARLTQRGHMIHLIPLTSSWMIKIQHTLCHIPKCNIESRR